MPNKRLFIDNSTLAGYKKCPRYYYLRYQRHLVPDVIRMPLVFGSCWHEGMDIIWKHYGKVSDSDLAQAAYQAFLNKWVEMGMPEEPGIETLERIGARNPVNAWEMFSAYITERKHILRDAQIIAIEQPFAIPIYPDSSQYWYVGRQDKIIQLPGEAVALEHKTTSEYRKDGGFKMDWLDQWAPNSQVEGYLFANALTYGPDKIRQVWIDGALVHKTERRFKFVPVSAVMSSLDQWVEEMRSWISHIETGKRVLEEGGPLAVAFPRNTDQCIGKYGKCEYHDICRYTVDPSKSDATPNGYKVEKWEPFDVLKLEKLFPSNSSNDGGPADSAGSRDSGSGISPNVQGELFDR